MSQLLKIVLIDSLCAGAQAVLAMNGNTSVTGSNGIGKSSFLKLIPVFYGATPSRLVRAGTNRQSFANWYLPNASSFIVFEYTNSEGLPRCAIMHRRGEAYAYRLVPCAWSPALLYTDYEAGTLVLPGELGRHLINQNIRCSSELQPLHYRKVIQYNSGSAHLEDIDDASMRKEIMALRPGFSLAPKRKDFAGIDNVTLALLESGGTFDTMKQTMAEVLLQENGDPSRTLMVLDGQQFRSVSDNLASYRLMDEMRGRINILADSRREYLAATRQLGVLKQRAHLLDDYLKERLEKRGEAQAELSRAEEAFQTATTERRAILSKALGEAQAALAQACERVNQIERQRETYEQNDMAGLRRQFDQLGEMNAQLEGKEQHLRRLKAAGQGIHELYGQRAQDAKDTAGRQRDEARNQAEAVRADIEERQERRREANALQEREALRRHSLEEEGLRGRLDESRSSHAREEASLAALRMLRVLPEAQAAIDQAQASIAEQQEAIDGQQATLQLLDSESRQLQAEQEALIGQHGGLTAKRNALSEEIEALKRQLNAGAETLLGFLRVNHPGWGENIARLVPASILMRTDLNPALLDAGSQGLYGVELSLSHLPPQVTINEPDLEIQIAQLSASRQAITEDLEALERQRRALDDRKRQFDARKAATRNLLSQAQSEQESRRGVLAGILSRAQAEHAQALGAQTERVRAAGELLAQTQEALSELKGIHGRELVDIRASGKLAIDELVEERRNTETRLKETLARIDATLKAELVQIDIDKAAALRAEGIDDQEVRRFEREIQTLAAQIAALNSRRQEIDSYLVWLRDTLPELPARVQVMQSHEAEKARLERETAIFESDFKLELAGFQNRRTLLNQEAREDGEQQRTLQVTLQKLGTIAPAKEATWSPGITAADIEDEASRLLRTRTDVLKRARGEFSVIRSSFQERGLLHTPQGGTIEQIATQARNAAGDSEMLWLEAAPALLEYIDVSHPDQKTKLIIQARNLSNELCDRHGTLQALHDNIAKVGREATAKACEVLGAAEREDAFVRARTFEQVQAIEFRVTSRIRSLSFWDDLSNYQQQYRRWSAMGDEVLPTDSFMDALRRVERQITEGAFTSKLSDCFDVSVSCREQGRTKVATNNAELIGISSTGVTKIIVAMIYVSLFELLRKDADFQMSIPIDEALELEAKNYIGMVDYFNSRGISMLACFPGGAPELLRQFPNRYTLQKRENGANSREIIVKEYASDLDGELDDLNSALAADEEEYAL
ncbi:ATP-binding protein [Geopseudomonas aromaticivorans]